MYVCMYGVLSLALGLAVNPYEGKLEDEKVERFCNDYWNVAGEEAVEVGLPDKFTLECVQKYIWNNGNYKLKKV